MSFISKGQTSITRNLIHSVYLTKRLFHPFFRSEYPWKIEIIMSSIIEPKYTRFYKSKTDADLDMKYLTKDMNKDYENFKNWQSKLKE